MDDFLFQFKDASLNPETTIDATNFGIVKMMKAIMNLQRTILNCPEGIFNRDEFVDNSLTKLRSLNKEERVDILMMELRKILWECLIPCEFIKSLFQEELNMESFAIEKQQYQRRKNFLVCYRGIQFLLERKFEIFINITIFQKVSFPTIKERVMEEYLSDITNDMIVCLIREGSVIIRCEIWKSFFDNQRWYKGKFH